MKHIPVKLFSAVVCKEVTRVVANEHGAKGKKKCNNHVTLEHFLVSYERAKLFYACGGYQLEVAFG